MSPENKKAMLWGLGILVGGGLLTWGIVKLVKRNPAPPPGGGPSGPPTTGPIAPTSTQQALAEFNAKVDYVITQLIPGIQSGSITGNADEWSFFKWLKPSPVAGNTVTGFTAWGQTVSAQTAQRVILQSGNIIPYVGNLKNAVQALKNNNAEKTRVAGLATNKYVELPLHSTILLEAMRKQYPTYTFYR